MKTSIIYLMLFFFSLINYGFIPQLLVVLLMLLFFNIYNEKFSFSDFKIGCIIFLIFLIYTMLSIFIPDIYLINSVDKDLFIFKFAQRLLFITSIISVCTVFNKELMIKTLLFLIKFNLVVFFLQIILFYLFNVNLDVLDFFRGISSRNEMIGYYRPTGIYAEPSNYGIVQLSFIIGLLILGYKNNLLYGFVFLSMILTFSTAIFFANILLLIIYIFKSEIYKNKTVFLLVISFAIPLLYVGLYFVSYRYSSFDSLSDAGSMQIRLSFINSILSRPFDSFDFYFGTGIYSYDLKNIIDHTNIAALSAVDDAGMFFSLLLRFGIVGAFVIIITIALYAKKDNNYLYMLPVLFCKYNMFNGLFLIPIIAVFVLKKR